MKYAKILASSVFPKKTPPNLEKLQLTLPNLELMPNLSAPPKDPIGHLILNGLVWKPNRQKESKRPWDVKPNGHNMYYKCKSFVNKNALSCFILQIILVAHVCLTWYQSRWLLVLLQCEPLVLWSLYTCQFCLSPNQSWSTLPPYKAFYCVH